MNLSGINVSGMNISGMQGPATPSIAQHAVTDANTGSESPHDVTVASLM
jgi:hypothetical protein